MLGTLARAALTAAFLAALAVLVGIWAALRVLAAPAPVHPPAALIEQPPVPPMFGTCEPQAHDGRFLRLRCCRRLGLQRNRICLGSDRGQDEPDIAS